MVSLHSANGVDDDEADGPMTPKSTTHPNQLKYVNGLLSIWRIFFFHAM